MEKQIEEMANDINKHCVDLSYNSCGIKNCTSCIATALYNAGYRKVDEDYAIQCTCYALGCQEAEKIEKKALEEFLKKLKEWLDQIAINNVGCKLEGDFSDACKEIISRLDGLKKFIEETKGK